MRLIRGFRCGREVASSSRGWSDVNRAKDTSHVQPGNSRLRLNPGHAGKRISTGEAVLVLA